MAGPAGINLRMWRPAGPEAPEAFLRGRRSHGTMTGNRTKLLGAALTAAVTAALLGCSPIQATRGNIVQDEKLVELQVGMSTANDVVDVLGTPSTVATFDNNVWYYIGQRTERIAFFRPEVIERRILVVEFDPDTGILQTMEELDYEDGQEVALIERETPTLGRRMTFLEQMFGNIGRFGAPE